MSGHRRFLAICGGLAVGIVVLGFVMRYVVGIRLEDARTACYAENVRRASAGVPTMDCATPPYGSSLLEERQVYVLTQSHRDTIPEFIAAALVVVLVGALPLFLRAAWRFFLARISELSSAIRGK